MPIEFLFFLMFISSLFGIAFFMCFSSEKFDSPNYLIGFIVCWCFILGSFCWIREASKYEWVEEKVFEREVFKIKVVDEKPYLLKDNKLINIEDEQFGWVKGLKIKGPKFEWTNNQEVELIPFQRWYGGIRFMEHSEYRLVQEKAK